MMASIPELDRVLSGAPNNICTRVYGVDIRGLSTKKETRVVLSSLKEVATKNNGGVTGAMRQQRGRWMSLGWYG